MEKKPRLLGRKKHGTVTGAKQLADAINVGLDHRSQMFVSLVMI